MDDATDDTASGRELQFKSTKEAPHLVRKAMGKLQLLIFDEACMLRNHIDQRCGVSVSESGSWSSWKLSGSQCLSSPGVQVATGVEEICA